MFNSLCQSWFTGEFFEKIIFIPPILFLLTAFVIFKFFIHSPRTIKVLLYLGLCIPIAVLILFSTAFALELADDPIASNYFQLNAAIKNTCYLDPNRKNCPKTLEELIAIEPENFQWLLNKPVQYLYYPDSHEYTLYIKHDTFRGVIFDPKFSNYGLADFVDLNFACFNRPTPFQLDPQRWDQYLTSRPQLKIN